MLSNVPKNAAENARRAAANDARKSEWERAQAGYKEAIAAWRARHKRQRPVHNALRNVRRRAAASRPTADSAKARNALQILAYSADAFANARPLDIGDLGQCGKCAAKRFTCDCAATLMCTYCGALLFKGEEKKASTRGPFGMSYCGGKLCCSSGTIDLQPIQRDEAVEAVWRNDAQRKVLLKHIRKFNNALALASSKANLAEVLPLHTTTYHYLPLYLPLPTTTYPYLPLPTTIPTTTYHRFPAAVAGRPPWSSRASSTTISAPSTRRRRASGASLSCT
jgi:hypothetical protein